MRNETTTTEVAELSDADFPSNEVKIKRKQSRSFIFFILSSLLFLLAAIFSMLVACFPAALVQRITSLVESVFRLSGYGSWFGYATERSECELLEESNGEYSLLSKDADVASLQHEKYAAWIGIFACVAVIVSLTCPPAAAVALLIGLWGFTVSNAIWAHGCQKNMEFGQKKCEVANNDSASRKVFQLEYEQARAYRNYALGVTLLSLFVVIMATVVVFFPPSIALIGLTIVAGISVKSAVTTSIGTATIGLLGYSLYKRKKMEDAKKLIANRPTQMDLEIDTLKLLPAK